MRQPLCVHAESCRNLCPKLQHIPLDTAKYILAARSALDGDAYFHISGFSVYKYGRPMRPEIKMSGSTLEDLLNKMTDKKGSSESIKEWKDYVRAYWDHVQIQP